MEGLSNTILIPKEELTPGQVGTIRNGAIEFVVARAMKELGMSREKLVVRDVRPYADLASYSTGTTASTIEHWKYSPAASAAGWVAFTPTTGTMGDNKFVCFFGIRDLAGHVGLASAGPTATDCGGYSPGAPAITFVKFNVGGSDKVTWDCTGCRAYNDKVAFTPSPVLIPQNAGFIIYYYLAAPADVIMTFFQLIGVTVEPRGLTISP